MDFLLPFVYRQRINDENVERTLPPFILSHLIIFPFVFLVCNSHTWDLFNALPKFFFIPTVLLVERPKLDSQLVFLPYLQYLWWNGFSLCKQECTYDWQPATNFNFNSCVCDLHVWEPMCLCEHEPPKLLGACQLQRRGSRRQAPDTS